jgi:hypothetical protein
MSDNSYSNIRKSISENKRKGAFPFPTYAQALFSQVFISRTPVEGQFISAKKKKTFAIPGDAPTTDQTVSSEKSKVFSALDKFVDEKMATSSDGAVKFPGGKITKKESQESTVISLDDHSDHSPAMWVDEYDPKQLNVIFVGEMPKDFNEEEIQGDLLSKMILAMKLSPKSYTRVFFEKDKEVALTQWNEVLKRVSDQDEVIVISLGAMATNVILGRKERLSRIHGQEFQLNLQSSAKETKLVVFPVFHPDILQINPNMKRSAWLDLQKVMKRL